MTDDADVEARFLDALQTDPTNESHRLVYADWLEDRGDERAKYLRLESMMWTLPSEIDALRQRIDPEWLRAVTRTIDFHLVSYDDKISTIKLVRTITGMGLKEAKDFVEAPLPALVKSDISIDQARRWIAEAQTMRTKVELRRGSVLLAADALVGSNAPARDLRVVITRVYFTTESERDIALQALIAIRERDDWSSEGILVEPEGKIVREGVSRGEAINIHARLRAVRIESRVEIML